jgi:diguanylate cyclase (GGDEF)-like protein/PAS domain S-box-containing protein
MSHSKTTKEKPSKVPDPQPEIIRVLLIEDNPGDARLVKEMLVDAGASKFSLTHAGLLSEGLTLLRNGSHHVILLDLSLPDGHGLDTVKQMCVMVPHLPVVILTGLDDERIAIRAVQEGAEDYLVKGQMDGNLLARAIRYAIERKRAEEALRESEERYRTILENVEDGYYETDLAGNLTAFNDSMCRISRTPREQLIGLNNRRYMDLENAKRVYQAFNDVYRTGQPYRAVDWEITRRDGSKAYIEASISLRKDAAGKPIGFRGILRDITERKRKDELLRQSEERYRTILEDTHEGYFEIDLAGNFTFLNDEVCTRLGYSREELIGKNYRLYTDPKTMEKVFQAYNELYRTGEPIKGLDGKVFRKNGTEIIHEVSASLIRDSEGKPIGFRGVSRDITERKRTEELLRQSEEKHRTIIENIQDGYFEVDLAGNFTFVNDVVCTRLGYSRGELIGMNNRQYTDETAAKKTYQLYNRVYRTGEPVRDFEEEIVRKDGTGAIIELSVSLIRNPEGKAIGFRGLSRDVTERKRAEEALRQSEERFRQLAENIREVFYISEQGCLRYVSPAYMEIWGRTPQHLYEDTQSFLDTVHPEDKENVRESLMNKGRGEVEQVYRIVRPDGSIRWIKDRSSPIYDDLGKTLRVVGIAADITDLKLGEEKLKYLSLHDPLTGLYNRIYFEEEMSRIEKGRYDTVGIVSCDVDGLKLVNDTLGHDQGDNLLVTAAGVIRECFREGDLVARIGGDEFCIILPDASGPAVENACQRIQEAVASYNATGPEILLSISVGSAVSKGANRNPRDLFKEADNSMYRKKLYHTQSVRSTIVKTLINTLKERDLTTESHVIRLEKLLGGVAAFIGLPESARSDLSLFAKFHDIGKVGISDAILFKEGPLTSEEWTEMKRHCEIGYRIALSAPELIPIADWILKHHEWWDGRGYPFGINGEEIPVECRLLAIADAYEVLTSARPYRKTLSRAEAVAELQRYTGTQFDPKLLEKFVQMLETGPPELESEGAVTF